MTAMADPELHFTLTRYYFQVYSNSAAPTGPQDHNKGEACMLRKCALCGKGAQTGKRVVRKGMAKQKGGTGSKIVRSSKRKFLPNLQKMRILLDGISQKAYLCAKCIKKGNFQRA